MIIMVFCTKCGKEISDGESACKFCGAPLVNKSDSSFIIVTTPTIAGYYIKKVMGIVTAITPRTRGVGGKIIAGFQSAFGGEVTAFTTELEKARADTMDRLQDKASSMGANAVVGLDIETTDLGLQAGVVAISATGTAVLVEAITE
jgi:uncharacterized protein YbjQ (UPF0145 family)